MAQDGSLAKPYVVCTRTFLIGWGSITDQGITCNATLRTLNQAACANAAWVVVRAYRKIGIAAWRSSNC